MSFIIFSADLILNSACVLNASLLVVLNMFLSVVKPFETPSTYSCTFSIGVTTKLTVVFGISFKFSNQPTFTADG